MEDYEYETPVDFGDSTNPRRGTGGGSLGSLASSSRTSRIASGTSWASGASASGVSGVSKGSAMSSRITSTSVASAISATSAVSAPVHLGSIHNREGNSLHSSPPVIASDDAVGMAEQRRRERSIRSTRELERQLRHRNHGRAFRRPRHGNDPTSEGKDDKSGKSDKNEAPQVSKVLTDLLLQTAILSIDTTAKLSKPTLALTKHTLLPQIILPLLHELWETYAPIRLQTWANILPSALHDLWIGGQLWDTPSAKSFLGRMNQLADDLLDLTTSPSARQCSIDLAVLVLQFLESLHTPEVHRMLTQCAISACRILDVLSSGKGKQLWFDVAEGVWSGIELGNEGAVVESLAGGVGMVCFALERERDSLRERRRRRREKGESADGENDVDGRVDAARKRRERDRRQLDTYPPGKAVVREGYGDECVEEAFLNSLEGNLNKDGECNMEQDENYRINAKTEMRDENDGPPRVIVPTSPNTNNATGSKERVDDIINNQSENANPTSSQKERTGPFVVEDVGDGEGDSQSEITTDIEDLHEHQPIGSESRSGPGGSSGPNGGLDDNPQRDYKFIQSLAYSEDEPARAKSDGEFPTSERMHNNDNDGNYNDNGNYNDENDNEDHGYDDEDHDKCDDDASEMYDTFNESILQFYRRLNEVLVQTRKEALSQQSEAEGNSLAYALYRGKRKERKGDEKDQEGQSGQEGQENQTKDGAAPINGSRGKITNLKALEELLSFIPWRSEPIQKMLHILQTKWWRILIVMAIVTISITCLVWFALGCYGFYVLVFGGGNYLPLHVPISVESGISSTSAGTPSMHSMQEARIHPTPNIVINIVTGQNSHDMHARPNTICDNTKDGSCLNPEPMENNDPLASITLEDWDKLKHDVDAAIGNIENIAGSFQNEHTAIPETRDV